MKTSRLAQKPRQSVQVLLCLVGTLLLVLVPVLHHHPVQASGAAAGASEQYCTLCVVHSGITLDEGTPSLGVPETSAEPLAPASEQPDSSRALTHVDDRAPPPASH